MAWGGFYTASASWGAASTTGTWLNATGGAITLPAAPSGANGFTQVMYTSATASPSGIVTALTPSTWGVSQAAAQSGVLAACVGHSIIA